MTPDDLLARLAADLRVAHAVRSAVRPAGLTASRVLGCSSLAARVLLEEPEGAERDVFRGARGTWLHNGLADDLALADPGFTDGRTAGRFAWDPGEGLPVITGEYDFLLEDVVCEVKTRGRDVCRWAADHGADPDHAAQVSMAAAALGLSEAVVIYLPNDAGFEETAVCPVDVDHWTSEAREWLHRVDVRAELDEAVQRGVGRAEAVLQVLDPIPREPQVAWCRDFCRFFAACRGDYVPPADLEVLDPVLRAATLEAEAWRGVRLDAEKREKAAKSRLTRTDGVVTDGDSLVKVHQETVAPTPSRRGYRKTVVDRRPG